MAPSKHLRKTNRPEGVSKKTLRKQRTAIRKAEKQQ